MYTIEDKTKEIEKTLLSEFSNIGCEVPSHDLVLEELKAILQDWNEDGSEHPEKKSWTEALEILIVRYKIKSCFDKRLMD